MSKNDLKGNNHPKNAKKKKKKISYSDSHANETHLWIASSKKFEKKMQNALTSEP
jgi:hypothetical protein